MTETSSRRTAELFAWLNQVKTDPELPASAFKVAFELGQWINAEEFQAHGRLIAWPSLKTIAAGVVMGVKEARTVRDMVGRLAANGHLMVCTGHGPGNPSRYRLIIKTDEEAAVGCRIETGSSLPLSPDENRQQPAAIRNEKRQYPTPKAAAGCLLNILITIY